MIVVFCLVVFGFSAVLPMVLRFAGFIFRCARSRRTGAMARRDGHPHAAGIDALTFRPGLRRRRDRVGVALSQIDNVSPNLGQGYIIDSFMVVVFGGVGNLWGTLRRRAVTLGIANKLLEPSAGAVAGPDRRSWSRADPSCSSSSRPRGVCLPSRAVAVES